MDPHSRYFGLLRGSPTPFVLDIRVIEPGERPEPMTMRVVVARVRVEGAPPHDAMVLDVVDHDGIEWPAMFTVHRTHGVRSPVTLLGPPQALPETLPEGAADGGV